MRSRTIGDRVQKQSPPTGDKGEDWNTPAGYYYQSNTSPASWIWCVSGMSLMSLRSKLRLDAAKHY